MGADIYIYGFKENDPMVAQVLDHYDREVSPMALTERLPCSKLLSKHSITKTHTPHSQSE